ncbi:hypothetical protein N9U63_02160 [Candidatus Pelagibacter sp.]|nr:hypothetical protein [Candidatus Pelagibacter sp.]
MTILTFIPLIEIFTFTSLFVFFSKFIIQFINNHQINKKFVLILLSIKTFFFLAIFIYGKIGNSVDSKSIYDMSTIFFDTIYKNFSYRTFFGSDFLSLIISPITNFGKLRYFNTSLLFMLLGFYASLLFYVVLIKNSQNRYQEILSAIIVLYPTLNLYTSYITKDLLIFFFLAYLLFIINFEIKQKYFNYKLLFIAIGILLIRPYIFIILSISTITIFIILYKFKKVKELLFSMILIILSVSIFLLLFNKIYVHIFSGGGNLFEQILNYLSDRANITNIGTSKINLNELSFLGKILSIIFGPPSFTFNFSNIFFLTDKIFVLFILSHILIIKLHFKKIEFNSQNLLELSLLFYSILLCLLLSLSVSNFGIALRLKLMFLPIFFYFLIKNQLVYRFKIK